MKKNILLKSAYQEMVESQIKFSDIAIMRAIEIGQDSNVTLDESQVLGVSFLQDTVIVSLMYLNENNESRQMNLPIPRDCLWEENWKEIFEEVSNKAIEELEKIKANGELEKAIGENKLRLVN